MRVKKKAITLDKSVLDQIANHSRSARGDILLRGEGKPVTLDFELVEGVHYFRTEHAIRSAAHGIFYPLGSTLSYNVNDSLYSFVSSHGFYVSTKPLIPGGIQWIDSEDTVILPTGCFAPQPVLANDKLLVESLVKIYQQEIFPFDVTFCSPKDWWLVAGYALIRAMDELKNPIGKQEWLYNWATQNTNLSATSPIRQFPPYDDATYCFPPFSLEAKKSAVAVNAIRNIFVIREAIESRQPISTVSILTAIRRVQGFGWGKWFLKCEPKPCWYEAIAKYKKDTHEVHLTMRAPDFRGERIVVHVTEWSGAVIEKILQPVDDGKGRFSWILTLSKIEKNARGGRHKFSEEKRGKEWKAAGTPAAFISLMKEYQTRKFWDSDKVKHIIIDPQGTSLLFASSFQAPGTWWLEILDQLRMSTQKDKIPFAMQLCAVRESLKSNQYGSKVRMLLLLLLGNRNLSATLRTEIIQNILLDANSLLIREAWKEYVSVYEGGRETIEEEPEPFIVEAFVRHGIMKAEKSDVELMRLLIDFITIVEEHNEYKYLRPLLREAVIQFPYEKKLPKRMKNGTRDVDFITWEETCQYLLLRWAHTDEKMEKATQEKCRSLLL